MKTVNTISERNSVPNAIKYVATADGWDVYQIGDALPPEPAIDGRQVPESITLFQARAALRASGNLDAVAAFMASDKATPEQKDAWEYSPVVPRDSDTVAQLTMLLGITKEDMDGLFILGDSIHI